MFVCLFLPFPLSPIVMAVRCHFENNNEVGAFSILTNKYCVVAESQSDSFASVFQSELSDVMPVIQTSVGGMKIIGSMCVGNKNGLVLPHNTTDMVSVCLLSRLSEARLVDLILIESL